MKTIVIVTVGTIGLVLLADRVQEIGVRIPYVLLSMWAGSATIAALIFSAGQVPPVASASVPPAAVRSRLWNHKMRLIGVSMLPLAWMPLLELRHSGPDRALWLMNGTLVVSVCSAAYYWLLARSVHGAVALCIVSLSMLWHFSAWALFTVIVRLEAAKDFSTVDTTSTLHAFLAPEYRAFFYFLCGAALLVYCPVMMWLGYRRFLADRALNQAY